MPLPAYNLIHNTAGGGAAPCGGGNEVELVSVIMPTHNAARWVAYTLDNLAAQTYPHFELVVADDGSQDDTVAVVRNKLAKGFSRPWKIIELGTNCGPSAARNAALKEARGTWVQYLDSDDFIAPQKIQVQAARCAQVSAEVAAVYSPWRQCHIDDGCVRFLGQTSHPDMRGRAPIMCLVGRNRVLQGAGLTRRSVLEKIGGWNEALRFWECEEITFRIAQAGRLEYVPSQAPLYFWRQHRGRSYIGNAGARYQTTAVALGWIDLILKGLNYQALEDTDLSVQDRSDVLETSSFWARQLYQTDRAAFREYLARARMLDPHLAPASPGVIAALGRHIGYEPAEAVAQLGSIPLRLLRKVLQVLRLR